MAGIELERLAEGQDGFGWTTGLDDIRMFATARLMLHNFDHIKAYWMIQGLKICQVALQFGADDMETARAYGAPVVITSMY